MKKLFLFSFFLVLFSCAKYVPTPKNKLSKDEMSSIIVELTLNEDVLTYYPKASIQEGTFFILKKYNITPEDFKDNYAYYVARKDMDNILKNAQKKLKNMHPRAAEHLKK